MGPTKGVTWDLKKCSIARGKGRASEKAPARFLIYKAYSSSIFSSTSDSFGLLNPTKAKACPKDGIKLNTLKKSVKEQK